MREHQDRRLGEILVARGVLTHAELAAALAEQNGNHRLFGEILVALGFVSSSAVADALAEQRGWSTRSDFGADSGPGSPPEASYSAPQLEPDLSPPLQLPPLSAVPPLVHAVPARLETELAAAQAELATVRSALAATEDEAERLRRELALRLPQPSEDTEENGHLAFVPTASGYRLIERPGPAPGPGEQVEVSLDGEVPASFVVAKRAHGPIPGGRRCAYLQPL